MAHVYCGRTWRARQRDLAGESWKHGGGAAWLTGSFDPELHTVYWGTGNPGSWNAIDRKATISTHVRFWGSIPRPGKSNGTTSSRQTIHSTMTRSGEMVLATIDIKGMPTKVIMHANKNGFLYVLDRTNGNSLPPIPL